MSARTVSLRNAVAAACALVIAFIGVVHEVVGTTLYPEGPALLGGLAACRIPRNSS